MWQPFPPKTADSEFIGLLKIVGTVAFWLFALWLGLSLFIGLGLGILSVIIPH